MTKSNLSSISSRTRAIRSSSVSSRASPSVITMRTLTRSVGAATAVSSSVVMYSSAYEMYVILIEPLANLVSIRGLFHLLSVQNFVLDQLLIVFTFQLCT